MCIHTHKCEVTIIYFFINKLYSVILLFRHFIPCSLQSSEGDVDRPCICGRSKDCADCKDPLYRNMILFFKQQSFVHKMTSHFSRGSKCKMEHKY